MYSVARMALKPGMELAEDVLSSTMEIILPANTVLTEESINKLSLYSVMCVSIKDESDYAVTHFERVRCNKNYKEFERVYINNLNAYKYMIDSFLHDQSPINLTYLMQIHDNIAMLPRTREQLLDWLYNMLPNEDVLTYAHSLNSALVANVFGIWLGLDDEDIRLLTLSGFFYDIGKMRLPADILWKSDKLTDEEFDLMKTHTTIGYNILLKKGINERIANATLMHHERADGSGYPSGLKDNEIDIFARYMAVVDSYVAMTSARSYRPALNPFEVIKNFQKIGVEKFGNWILRPILSRIANIHLGATVKLSNGMIGDVILINQDALTKPLIKHGDELIDMTKIPDVEITAIL